MIRISLMDNLLINFFANVLPANRFFRCNAYNPFILFFIPCVERFSP